MSPYWIALTVTDVLLLGLFISQWVGWTVKVLTIVAVLGLNFVAWNAADSGKGWPVAQPLPDPAQYVSCIVVEPDVSKGEEGSIYVEVIPLELKHGILSYRPHTYEPRTYREPYDRSLHRACEAAKRAAAQGIPVQIKGPKGKRRKGSMRNPGQYHAYVLPSPQLPRKGDS